jgi:hypothetical protein
VRFFSPFVDNSAPEFVQCEPYWWHHKVSESVSRICGVARWFCRLRTKNCTIHAWPRRCPFYRAVVPQLARGWV